MCDPVSVAGLALSAGGTFLQQREANKNQSRIQNAKNQAFAENMTRQQQYADEAGAALKTSTDNQGREAFDEDKEASADQIKQAFSEREITPDYNVGLRASAPKNVVQSRERETAEANADTDRNVNNLAQLSGYQNSLFKSGLDRNEFARVFGNIQDTAQRDSNLLGLDISAAANNANKAPSLFPTLLKTAGQAANLVGAASTPAETINWNQGGTTTIPRQYNLPFGSQVRF